MNELVEIIWEHLRGEDGPEVFNEYGELASDGDLLAIAQGIVESIIAAGWPRKPA